MSDKGLSAYSCTPREIRRYVIRCIKAGRVPFIESSPAMGKSAIVASIAKEFNLKLIDHRLSTSAPEDLSGLPKFRDNDTATFAPFDTFPVEGTPLPQNPDGTEMQGWLLFLDEFNSASKAIQAAAYKLVLDKAVGLRKLHQRVVIVCAGNLSTDRAIVNPIGTAMQSRLIWLRMKLDLDEFLEDVAFKHGWDSRIIAYLSYKKLAALHDFRPDHNEKTFCSPRTWEFMNDLIRGEEVKQEDAALYAGTITSGVAVDFINFTKVYEHLPRVQIIVKDPEGAQLPTDAPTRWATVTHLQEHADEDNFDALTIYVGRLPMEFRILFYRGLMIRKPELKKLPAFRKAMVELSRYLNDDPDTSPAAVAA